LPGEGQPATVKVTKPDVTLEITFEDGRKLVVAPKGTPLKAGTYWVKSFSISRKDKDGRTWELRSTKILSNMQVIIVEEGQETILDLGPPILFVGWLGQEPNKPDILHIRCLALGRYAEGYFPGAFLLGKRPPLPTFRVLDAAGKTVLADRFSAAKDNEASYMWTIPRGLTGKLQLEIQPVMGPFEWTVKPAEFEIK
jgi:hypothetical protein